MVKYSQREAAGSHPSAILYRITKVGEGRAMSKFDAGVV